ncbi:MAG: hypothetical protein COA50_02630 [Flavobacteriaceae bacterium]|nr:MAG: hypothetical protein COA50_02630 [Flavobacteriaceae bacterium]
MILLVFKPNLITMKKSCLAFLICYTFLLYSYKNYNACDFAGTNITYVLKQTQKALETEKIDLSKFFAYKAINGIEKSKEQLAACDCDSSKKLIYKGLDNLKKATKEASLFTSKEFLNTAYENISEGYKEIEAHRFHSNQSPDKLLAMNSKNMEMVIPLTLIVDDSIQKKIDSILTTYEASLQKVVATVNCKEAKAMASKIYKECEAELLKSNLTETKRYYNFRTKEITKKALNQIGDCNN